MGGEPGDGLGLAAGASLALCECASGRVASRASRTANLMLGGKP